jgi:hypothetical protein
MTKSDLAGADLPAFPFEGMTGLDVSDLFARLRERDPVRPVRVASGGRVYLVARYEDVRRVLTDPVFSRVVGPPVDFVSAFAAVLPATVISDLLAYRPRTTIGCANGWRSRCPPGRTPARRSRPRCWSCRATCRS